MENKENNQPNHEATNKPVMQPKTEQQKTKEEPNPNNITAQGDKPKTPSNQNNQEQNDKNKHEEETMTEKTHQKTSEVKTPIALDLNTKKNNTENPIGKKGGL